LSDRIEISERCTRDAFVYMNEKDHMDFKEIFITNEIARAKCASTSTAVRPLYHTLKIIKVTFYRKYIYFYQ
jgi:hypothetical protein